MIWLIEIFKIVIEEELLIKHYVVNHLILLKIRNMTDIQGWIQRFWIERTLYVNHHGWPTKKILGFRWFKKAKVTLETKVFGETFLSVFSDFLFFNESLPMKSYQFFKIYIRFYKKREEKHTLIQQPMKKEKLRKSGIRFI